MLDIVPIVEGHGEYAAIRVLLERIAGQAGLGGQIAVQRPIRVPKGKLVKKGEVQRAVELASINLDVAGRRQPGLVLLLVDADRACPASLGPKVLRWMRNARADRDHACVVAMKEYESWFVASAESMADVLRVVPGEEIPEEPEKRGLGKAWIARRMRGQSYSETVDQPRLSARVDVSLARRRSPSFDKLCREVLSRLGTAERRLTP